MSVVIPVILCGGSGTRLWPLSRSNRPKQLISLGGDHTLLEGTLLRARTISGASKPICVTAAAYGAEVRQSLERLGLRGTLLLEPEPRNTAPALCAAALVATQTDANAVIVALPADHVIEDIEAFVASIAQAVTAAEKNWLAILGVRPRNASSALGYIVPGEALDGFPQVHRVSRFVEKPEPKIATSLVSAGALWNAGIVVARASTIIDAMREHEPAVLEAVERSLAVDGGEVDDVRLSAEDFAAAPSISFDKAVLERHRAVAVTALDATWRDVGTWAEVAELYPADGDGNRNSGRVRLTSSRDSFVFSPHRLMVGIGLTDLIVVDTPDAMLVANRHDQGRLREVVEAMNIASFPEVASGDRLVTLTGYPNKIVSDEATRAFRISLGAREIMRCEPHHDVSRHWIILQGTVQVIIEGAVSTYDASETFHIPPDLSYAIGNIREAQVNLIAVHLLAKVQNKSHPV